MKILIFTTIFLYITNWNRIRLIFRALFNPRTSFKRFEDKEFIKKISKKLGVKLNVIMQNSPKIFGYAFGTPKKPTMVISFGARKYLNDNELEWIILHEAGHCILWHIPKTIFAGFVVLVFGIATTYYFNIHLAVIPFYALLLGIFYYQLEREISERSADTFALKRLSNPKAMATANQKMKQRVTSIFYKQKILTKLFTGHLLYDERIKIANKKLIK